jgi:hypothetical protein|tara:strand:+ start:61 stop:618 length:558 start_codon:yes stop_codon:yes gene_type:complete
MAQSKFIQNVVKDAGGRPKSTQWYRDKIKEFGQPGAMDLIRDGKQSRTPHYGRMNMFFYDPKGRKTLPYYDTFPLVLPIERYPDGFLGINFHYLPMALRLKLLDRIVDFSNNTKFDESTIINADYAKLKNIKEIKPTLKRYLAGRVKTRFRRVDADEFTVAALLPIARWKKGTQQDVYRDSRKMI